MYTSHLDLNNDNIQAMLDIAQCLQVQNVLNMCYSFLKLTSNVESVTPIPCSNSEPLPGNYPAFTNSESSEQLSTPILEDPVTEARHSLPLLSDKGSVPSAEAPKPTSVTVNSSSKELPLKQYGQPYKLRDFYSKLFYKENADKAAEQATTATIESNLTESQPWTLTSSESILAPSDSLPLEPLPAFSHTFVSSQDQETPLLQFPTEMRLKKAIHFLRSQKAAEESAQPIVVLQNTIEETVFTNEVLDNTEQTFLEKEADSEMLENIAQDVEGERPESPNLEDASVSVHKHCACDLCGKTFKHPSNLGLHKRSHTGTVR